MLKPGWQFYPEAIKSISQIDLSHLGEDAVKLWHLSEQAIQSSYATFTHGSSTDKAYLVGQWAHTGTSLAANLLLFKGMGVVAESSIATRVGGLWGKNGIEKGIGLTTRLNRSQIKDYLANIHTVSREQLVQDLESVGFVFKGGSKDARFMEFIDKYSNTRVKIHPPDNVGTDYHHIHIYDKSGNSLNSQLKTVSYKSPEAHIKIIDSYQEQLSITSRNDL